MFTLDVAGKVLIARITETRLDTERKANELSKQLTEIIQYMDEERLLLNVAVLEFITSSSIGQLFVAKKYAQARNIQLATCCVNDVVLETLQLVRWTDVVPMFENEEQALSEFGEHAEEKPKLRIRLEELINAAGNGSSCAMLELGRCFEEGNGTRLDPKTAFDWYLQANGSTEFAE